MNHQNPPDSAESVTVGPAAFTHEDIRRVVDDFYGRVQNDPILQVPFSSVHDWPGHIKRLTHFWWIRFGGAPYLAGSYNPVLKHYVAGFNAEFLSRWLGLFHDTLKTHLTETQAVTWARVSESMGQALSVKNELFKKQCESGPGAHDRS